MTTLHITNGDHAAHRIREAGLEGTVLPWRDVLHEGPVPAELSPAQLRVTRARFIAEQAWSEYLDVLAEFVERDQTVDRLGPENDVVLWFEHDLYDQLQLIQVLDMLAGNGRTADVTLILTSQYLGPLEAEALLALRRRGRPATGADFAAARGAWRAIRSPDPRAVEAWLADETGALPFLGAALRRHLEEFPWVGDGLSRSERQALEAIAAGASSLGEAFVAAHHQREEALFLGDTVFASYLERLGQGPEPLIVGEGGRPVTAPKAGSDAAAFWQQRARVTATGRAVLGGWRDWVAVARPLRWLGGVELRGTDTRWRWDPVAASLVSGAPPR